MLVRRLQSQFERADWTTKPEIIRVIGQQIEIASTNTAVVLRLSTATGVRAWT
jgi:hypothetical protein